MIQNIFIVHTPFHVYIAEVIVKNSFKRVECENIILLELNRDYKNIDHKLWTKIDFLENVGGSTLGCKSYLMSEENVKIIKQNINSDMDTYVFISDIAWPMNNRIFFDKYLRRRVKYCLFSDGLGTYVLPKVTKSLFLRGVAKSVNGLVHRGVRYTNYLGNQFGLDRNEIEYIYAPNIGLVECEQSKKREVFFELTQETVNFKQEKCLFLDQPFWLHMKDSDWYPIREASVKFIRSLDVNEIYYKNHHFGRKEDLTYYESQGFNIIISNKCAEQLVAEDDFGTVISYLGSALFNLKCMYHDKLRCISLFSKAISQANGYNDSTPDKLISLFNDVNVEIIDIL